MTPQVSRQERHAQMQRLTDVLHARFGLVVPGDEVYWHEASCEARVRAYAGSPTELFYTRFDALGFADMEACGPILHCPVHDTDSLDRLDTPDIETLHALTEWAIAQAEQGACLCEYGDSEIETTVSLRLTATEALIWLALIACIIAWLTRRSR